MSGEGYYRAQARPRRQALIQEILALIQRRPTDLLPFEEVWARLRLRSKTYRGLQQIPLDKIVGSPYVQTMADLFHMSIEEADIPASIEKAGERIYHVHLADSNRKLPGLGHTDFAAALAALKEIGYDKYMALECGEPSQNTPLKGYYAKELPPSLGFLRKCL